MWTVAVISVKADHKLRARNQAERQRLIQKMLSEKDAGKPTQKLNRAPHPVSLRYMDENGHSQRHGCSH